MDIFESSGPSNKTICAPPTPQAGAMNDATVDAEMPPSSSTDDLSITPEPKAEQKKPKRKPEPKKPKKKPQPKKTLTEQKPPTDNELLPPSDGEEVKPATDEEVKPKPDDEPLPKPDEEVKPKPKVKMPKEQSQAIKKGTTAQSASTLLLENFYKAPLKAIKD